MSLCFYYQQIYNIMKYNLFDNFYEVIEVIYNLPDVRGLCPLFWGNSHRNF